MPLIDSSYRPPKWAIGKHIQTIVPSVFRKVEGVVYVRERISTPDHDFLDLDWSAKGRRRLAIISHGLEGCAKRHYVLGMAKELNAAGWDTLSLNFRGCGGEVNQRIGLYHAGSTEDLSIVIEHVLKTRKYKEIALVGFSLGGNVILKYLGDKEDHLPSCITKAVVFSVPCDLHTCVLVLEKGVNRIYQQYLIGSLKEKMVKKAVMFPELLEEIDLSKIRTFIEFDNHFTAPLGGFRDALHYYEECSTIKSIHKIKIPVLIVNAQNDPFLSPESIPIEACSSSQWVFLEAPSDGGHIGFTKNYLHGPSWAEQRTKEFLKFSI